MIDQNNNTDTHQIGEPFGVSQEYLMGMIPAINKGYLTFCKRKRNILGKKCDRKHLLPKTD
jgi:hypothetical protein